MRAVFRQLDGCAHAPACLRDGRRPASAAVRDVPDCTRAFRRDACKRNSAVRYRGLVHLPGRLSNGAVKIRRTGRSSGFYVACRGKKMPPDGTRKSEGPAEREFLCRRLGRLPAGGGKAAGLSKAGNAGAGARMVPPHFLHRSRSVRPYLMQSAPDICPGRRCFYLKVVGQAAVLQKIKFGRVHGAEIQRDTENVR